MSVLPGIALAAVAYLLVVVAAAVFGWFASGQMNGAAPVASVASVAPSMAATPTPAVAESLSDRLGAVNSADVSLLLAVITLLVVIPCAVILFYLAVVRVCAILLRDQLVVADMVDSTNLDLKDQILGLSQMVREGVSKWSLDVNERYPGQNLGLAKREANPLATAEFAGFVESMKGAAPTPLAALLVAATTLIPPRGTKVACFLGQDTGSSQRLRLEVHISGLANGGETDLESVVSRAPSSSEKPCDQASTFAYEAGRWLAIVLLRRRLFPPDPDSQASGKTDADKQAQPNKRPPNRMDEDSPVSSRHHRMIGVELLWLAASAKVLDPEPLYLRVVEEFRSAADCDKSSYGSVEAMAEMISYLNDVPYSIERDALQLYQKAQDLYRSADEKTRANDPSGWGRIALASGQARLRTRDTELRESAEQEFRALGDASHVYAEGQTDLLYTAACWQATHARVVTVKGRRFDTDIRQAAQYLAFALVCRKDLRAWAKVDPDFGHMRPIACRLADAAEWLRLPQPANAIQEVANEVASDWLRDH